MTQRTFLDRSAILGASDITIEEIEIPEWGGFVRVKALTAAQRDQFEADSVQKKGKDTSVNMANIRARLVALTVVDAQGDPMFTRADIHALGDKSGSALGRIWDVATRLSGLSDSDIEELTKNSETDQSGDSNSV